jgi:glycerol-3-phosphate O-acyltransferase
MMFHICGTYWSSVQYHEGQIKQLKDVTANSAHPVIYLPLHKSHHDYMLFTWMLWRTGVKMPIQAAGENLKIFLFGYRNPSHPSRA